MGSYSPIYPGTNQKGRGSLRMRLSLVLCRDRKESVIVPRGFSVLLDVMRFREPGMYCGVDMMKSFEHGGYIQHSSGVCCVVGVGVVLVDSMRDVYCCLR